MNDRELKNIAFCMMYKNYFNHGASNHHLMCQLADAYELDYELKVTDNCIQLYEITDAFGHTRELVLELTNYD